jgi:hypothetical protein
LSCGQTTAIRCPTLPQQAREKERGDEERGEGAQFAVTGLNDDGGCIWLRPWCFAS